MDLTPLAWGIYAAGVPVTFVVMLRVLPNAIKDAEKAERAAVRRAVAHDTPDEEAKRAGKEAEEIRDGLHRYRFMERLVGTDWTNGVSAFLMALVWPVTALLALWHNGKWWAEEAVLFVKAEHGVSCNGCGTDSPSARTRKAARALAAEQGWQSDAAADEDWCATCAAKQGKAAKSTS